MISHRSRRVRLPDYVDPLPPEDFLKGITYRQKAYDEGIALVQKQLDNYRTVRDSLAKPQDKQYFDQEALKLVKAINSKAGLDFSAKSNVLSVLNTGKQLVNDPVIKQAAESTSTYNKMMEEYNKLDASKKSAVNDYFFFKELKAWQNDGKYGSKLNYNPYTVYTDEPVKLKTELISKLKPDVQEVFETDEKGQWIKKYKYTGVSGDRFKQAYNSTLSAQGKNQLRMEAQYLIETGNKAAYSRSYTDYLTSAVNELNEKLSESGVDLQNKVTKYGEYAPEVTKLNAKIADLQVTQQVLQNRLNQASNGQLSDDVLASYIQDQLLSEAAGAFAYQQKEQEIKANPYTLDRARTANDLALHKAKAQYNLKHGLNADGTKITPKELKADLLTKGYDEWTKPATNNTESLVPGASGKKDITPKKLFSDFAAGVSDTDSPFVKAGINKFLEGKTTEEVLKRALVAPTWSPADRTAILNSMSGKAALMAQLNADPSMTDAQKNIIIYNNQQVAENYLNYLTKVAASIYDVYDFQRGYEESWFSSDATDVKNANVTSRLLDGTFTGSNSNEQSNYLDSDLLRLTGGQVDLASTFGSDNTGLTFVPKVDASDFYGVYTLNDGSTYGKRFGASDFLNSDAATNLAALQDLRKTLEKE